ncbi:MAG: hypothetical protein ICV83_03935, partial [Cytophagales bacterium]|nr:hypothetical protein [Cytophagales bacterium]
QELYGEASQHTYPLSLQMLFGANLIRNDEGRNNYRQQNRRQDTEMIINHIKGQYQFVFPGDPRYPAWLASLAPHYYRETIYALVAVAYLTFQPIKIMDGNIFSKSLHFQPGSCKSESAEQCLQHAHLAYTLTKRMFEEADARGEELDEEDKYCLLYATNIFVFYSIEIGSWENFAEVIDAVNELRSYQHNYLHYWHYRYSDTLARNHHRLAVMSSLNDYPNRKNDVKAHIEHAQNHLSNALESADKNLHFRDVREINSYKQVLDTYSVTVQMEST